MWPFQNILFAFDACPQCRTTLPQAAQLAGKCGSRLILCDARDDFGKVDPAGRIVERAKHEGADLIFLPRHRPGSQPWPLKQTVSGVLGRARCSVWVAPHAASGHGPVVCALAPEPGSEQHLISAASIARAYRTTLHLVHAVPETPEP